MRALGLESVNYHLKISQRSGQPVDAGDDKSFAGMDEVENGHQLRTTFERCTTFLLLADDLAAGVPERGDLRGEVLVCCGCTGISDTSHVLTMLTVQFGCAIVSICSIYRF